MNLTIIKKKYAAHPEKVFPKKSILRSLRSTNLIRQRRSKKILKPEPSRVNNWFGAAQWKN